MAQARTAKSCGPDAPTLASSVRQAMKGPRGPFTSRMRRWQKSPAHRGEHEGNR